MGGLRLDMSLSLSGASSGLGPTVAWEAAGGANVLSITPNGNYVTLQGTGAGNNIGNTVSQLTGDFVLEIRPVANNSYGIYGYKADGTQLGAAGSYTELEFSIQIDGATAYALQGAAVLSSGAYDTAMYLRRVGTTISFLHGPTYEEAVAFRADVTGTGDPVYNSALLNGTAHIADVRAVAI